MLRKIFYIWLLSYVLLYTNYASALDREYIISTNPKITVTESGDRKTWRIYGTEGIGSVLLIRLGLNEAKYLLNMAETAKSFYKEIIDSGRCPDGIVKSGRFGAIKGPFSEIHFEVVCERNNILMHITMFDEHVVNFLIIRMEAKNLERIAKKLISALQ